MSDIDNPFTDVKPLRIVSKLKNNRLIRTRELLGYKTAKAAADAIGINQNALCEFETLRRPALLKRGVFSRMCHTIADFYRVPLDYLWPDEVAQLENCRPATLEITAEQALELVGDVYGAHSDPYQLMDDEQKRASVKALLATLTPRQEQVMRMRFGIDDGGQGMTHEDIGIAFEVTHSRIAQLEKNALRKLRHPIRSARVAEWGRDDERRRQSDD